MKISTISTLLCASSVFLQGCLACTYTVYNDEASWQAAVGSFTHQGFDTEPTTPSAVSSLTFGTGIQAQVTVGVSDSTEDLAVMNNVLVMTVDPDDPNDPKTISFTLPTQSKGLGMRINNINNAAALTRAWLRIGSSQHDLLNEMGTQHGFFGIATSDSSCYFTDFEFYTPDSSGQDTFDVSSIDFSASAPCAYAYTVYNDEAAWQAAVGTFTHQGFDTEPTTPSAVSSLTFATGIQAQVTVGVSDSTEDLGVRNNVLLMTVDPDDPNDPKTISFTLPIQSYGLGMRINNVNNAAARTRAWFRVNGGSVALDLFNEIGSNHGFFGIVTSNDACSFTDFEFYTPDSSGQDTFDLSSIDFAPATQQGTGMGDPHFQTWSGTWYDFHGECDMVFLSNPQFASGKGMDIHVRTRIRGQYSYIESAALRIGKDVLEMGGYGQYILNGVWQAAMPTTLGGGTEEEDDDDDYKVTFESPSPKVHVLNVDLGRGGQRIVLQSFKDMVAVKIFNATWDDFGKSIGLLGNFATGEMLGRDHDDGDDGSILKMNIDDPIVLAQQWQVRGTAAAGDDTNQNVDPSLFTTSRAPQYPVQCTMPPPAVTTTTGRRRLGENNGPGSRRESL